jgi:hypothetical protein
MALSHCCFPGCCNLPGAHCFGIVSSKEERHGKKKARFQQQAVRCKKDDAAGQAAR